jgi:hypothetical protein
VPASITFTPRWPVADLRVDIVEASGEARDGSAPSVRDAARTELPTLHKHLRMALGAVRTSG